ncbi:MAG: hypothetical protein QM778_17765 [Myxococcales bacterium]
MSVIAILVLLLGSGLVVAWLLRRPKPSPSSADDGWEHPFGLSLSGPSHAKLPAPDAEPTVAYPAVITAQLALPTSLWGARERLRLVLRSEDGRTWENTFGALDQPLGILIERAYEPPSDVPLLTEALLVPDHDRTAVQSEFRANIALLDLPLGTHLFHARAMLDDLRSNEITLEISVGAP